MSLRFIDKRRASFKDVGVATPVNYTSVAALDARLGVIDAAYWTAARLAATTYNDKVYAVRRNDDAAGI